MDWGSFKKIMEDGGVKDEHIIDWIDVRLFGDSLSDNGNRLDIRLPCHNELTEEPNHLVIEIGAV